MSPTMRVLVASALVAVIGCSGGGRGDTSVIGLPLCSDVFVDGELISERDLSQSCRVGASMVTHGFRECEDGSVVFYNALGWGRPGQQWHAGDGVIAVCSASIGAETATTSRSSPNQTSSTLVEGSALQPLERSVLHLFRRYDPSADTVEDGFQDARVETTLGDNRLVVYVAAPGFVGPGIVRNTLQLAVAVQEVETPAFGLVLRFNCELAEFGERSVEIAGYSSPTEAVDYVRSALACTA